MAVVDQDAVKTTITISFAEQVILCSENDALTFASADAGRRATKIATAALTYFNKNQGLPITADQVDFAATNTKITR